MPKGVLLLGCLLLGGILGYLLVSSGAPLVRAPAAPESKESGGTHDLRGDRERLLARKAELEKIRADRDRSQAWAEALEEPVRTVERIEDQETGAVRLLVRDQNGVPLAGRMLRFSLLGQRYSGEAETDDEGVIVVDGIPPGQLYVSVGTPGGRRSFYADVAAGFLTEILVPSPSGRATVVGTVRDRELGPLPGVRLSLSTQLGIYSDDLRAQTDGEGRFEFEAVPTGPWTLRAYGDPLGKNRRPTTEVMVWDEGEVQVDLLAGVESLSGTVRDATSGAPLPGVLVRIDHSGSDHMNQTSDENGQFRFLDLPPSKWEVEAILEGRVRWRGGPLPIGPGDTEDLDIPMQPAAEVVAVILNADGRPVTGRVGLNFRTPGERWSSHIAVGLASEKGEIRYRELPPGEFEVRGISYETNKRGMAVHTFTVGELNRVVIRLGR